MARVIFSVVAATFLVVSFNAAQAATVRKPVKAVAKVGAVSVPIVPVCKPRVVSGS